MNKIISLLLLITFLSCGKTQTTQPPLVDILGIAAHEEIEVHPYWGPGKREAAVKVGDRAWPKYSYKDGAVEIVYINGKADWITISLNEGKFDKTALGIIGLPVVEPTEASKNVMRWENHKGIKEISLFPKADGTIDYFYLKVLTE